MRRDHEPTGAPAAAGEIAEEVDPGRIAGERVAETRRAQRLEADLGETRLDPAARRLGALGAGAAAGERGRGERGEVGEQALAVDRGGGTHDRRC